MDNQKNYPKLILASASPRRRQLLEADGFTPIVECADIDERRRDNEIAQDYVKRVAQLKAAAVAAHHLGEDAFLIAADTIVVDGDHILGKPANTDDAIAKLENLSGHAHTVMTGVCVIDLKHQREHADVIQTSVYFSTLSKQRILDYVATGEPMDKAGAYGIQGRAAGFVKKIEGSYTNVVGLPVCEVRHILETLGFFD